MESGISTLAFRWCDSVVRATEKTSSLSAQLAIKVLLKNTFDSQNLGRFRVLVNVECSLFMFSQRLVVKFSLKEHPSPVNPNPRLILVNPRSTDICLGLIGLECV